MASFDILNNDAFRLSQLTMAMIDAPYQPGRLGELGWFAESGIRTTSIMIERKGSVLSLVPTMTRGAPATPKGVQKGKLLSLASIHLPQRSHVAADEVQNVRAFGTESELKAVQTIVNEKLGVMKQDIEVTMEYHRVGAMKGIVLDADGTTELYDFFDFFGLSQVTKPFNLGSNTDVRVTCHEAKRLVQGKLGNKRYTGLRAMCSAGFFDDFISNADVKKAWDRYQEGAWLRSDLAASTQGNASGGFMYGGILWEEYLGGINGTDFIADGGAYLVPEGVPNLFKTHFAPADYVETVNTTGLPYYAKMETEKFDKGVEMESQSNPLYVCTQPDAILKLKAGAS